LNPERVELVRSSWARLAGREEGVAEAFYARLFALQPDLEILFVVTDLEALSAKLVATLDLVVRVLHDPVRWSGELHASARRHALYGVGARAYRIGGEALLWALARELGAAFTPDVQAAWAEAYTATVARMRRVGRTSEADV
jgi:hemoglobin-like flavoprotein